MNDSKEHSNNILVRRIKNGTVIDHIPAGHALKVLNILKVDGSQGFVVTVAMNVQSKSMGKKDLVKLGDRVLDQSEINKISLVAHEATYNIIKNYRVVKKKNVIIPDVLEDLIKCENPNCVTNQKEPVKPKAIVVNKNPVKIKCYYCGRYITHIDEQVI